MTNYQPMKTGHSRVFLIEDRAGPTHKPSYQSCLAAQGIDQAFGDIEKIECPDPYRYGEWEEVGVIQGQKGRASVDLMGRYAMDLASEVLRLAKKRCAVDIQLHLGACKDPTDFTSFDKAIILENSYLTNWSTNELGALGSDGNAAVDETVSVSSKDVYEVLQLTASEKAGSLVVQQVNDVTICGAASCGECGDEREACDHIYAVTEAAATGSPANLADLLFSLDGGVTWYVHDVDSWAATEDGDGIACVGNYLVLISNDVGSLSYTTLEEVNALEDPTFTEVTTGFVAGANPMDIWAVGSVAFIVGDNGYVYLCTDPTAGVTVLDAGVAAGQDLNAVHALNEEFAVAVGDDGTVIYTENQTGWTATTAAPCGVGCDLLCVWVKTEYCWFVGDNAGRLWYTTDKGATWTQKRDFGASLNDISFATDSVGYVAVTTSTPAGQIWRTYDGGYQWTALPEGAGALPANDAVLALATCDDANFVVGVGLGDNGTDGYVVIAED